VFVALIHEERRRGGGPWLAQSMYGSLRKEVSDIVGRVVRIEAHHGVPQTIKEPDFGLTPAVIAWCGGASIEELAERTEASPGDVCRTLRMAIQLMREVRRAIDPDWDVFERLGSAIELVNRDEVDARRQLELG
jgi:superfamily II RNA helicase